MIFSGLCFVHLLIGTTTNDDNVHATINKIELMIGSKLFINMSNLFIAQIGAH